MTRASLLLIGAVWMAAVPAPSLPADEGWWPSFRGRAASGIGDGFDVPTSWNASDGTAVQWKTAIPGLGHSSPIAWGDRVYVTSAVPAGAATSFARGIVDTSASAGDRAPHEWRLFALDRATGGILWSRVAAKGAPATDRHAKATHANPTPATDGRYIAASFGSEGLFVYDRAGELKWSKLLGTLDGGWTPVPGVMWGFGSSPIIHDGLVVVQCDTQSASFLAAFDVETGRERWRVARGEDTSWSTPTIAIEDGSAVVLTSGTSKHRAYDLATGRELWSVGDGLDVKIPTPIVSGGMYLFGGGSSHDSHTFYAVRAGARGALDAANGLVWTSDASPHVPTPLAYRDRLYVISDAGILTTYDLASGARTGRCRIAPGAFMASPVAADGHVFFTSEDGDVYVITAGDACQRVSTNPIGEPIVATPALAPGQVIVRTTDHVIAFGGPVSRAPRPTT
jgi:outer membrane protein assembly factor BamB